MWYWIEANNNRRLRVPLVCSKCKHWNWWLFVPSEPSPQGTDNTTVHNNPAGNKNSNRDCGKDQ